MGSNKSYFHNLSKKEILENNKEKINKSNDKPNEKSGYSNGKNLKKD